MISKELLQCLNDNLTIKEVISSDNKRIDNNIYWKINEIDILQSKNVYELANQCKEWALKFNFAIYSEVTKNGGKASLWYKGKEKVIDVRFSEKSEPEAIFKACESLLGILNETK